MKKVDVAGLQVDATSKGELLAAISQRLQKHQKTFLVTLYSEFLYASLRDRNTEQLINSADILVADGVAVQWASVFLRLPFRFKNYYGKIVQALWQMTYSLAAIVARPQFVRSIIPERIVGAELIWDLARIAQRQHLSVYLLGGRGDVPNKAGKVLEERFVGLRIAGTSNKDAGDSSIIEDIKKARPDFVFVALGPVKQEQWIAGHKDELPALLYIGLGGTFDYMTGDKLQPVPAVRKFGLEWLFRLVTQPKRLGRITDATIGLSRALVRYKVFMSCGLRNNVVSVILNADNKVFVAKKSPLKFKIDIVNDEGFSKRQNYWQLPQGGVNEQEDLIIGARREVKEETGIGDLELYKVSLRTHSYVWQNALRSLWVNRAYQARGQTQHIIYFRYSGADDAVRLPEDEEFTEYQWVPVHSLMNIIHPERHAVLTIVQEDLKDLL